jgi:hypothetical protein
MKGNKMDLIFYYTGATFWAVFGVLFGLSLIGTWVYLWFYFRKWTYRRKYAIMLNELALSKRDHDEINSFFAPYSKEQKQLLYAMFDRMKKVNFKSI